MGKNVLISAITTVVMMFLILVGVDSWIKPVQPKVDSDLTQLSGETKQLSQIEVEGENPGNTVISTASVVGIAVKQNSGSKLAAVLDNIWSVGSGCILNSRGYIVTNYHVIGRETDEIYVTLYGGDVVTGKMIWESPELDLAVIKIPVAGLPSMTLGDSDAVRVGERAIAVGNPLGFEFQRTVTAGVISGLNRTVSSNGIFMEDLIQTDASINTGNSGGPLFNGKGELIGINTIKVESAEGMGFAIPINQIKPIIAKIIENGSFKEPYFGIAGYDREMTANMASEIYVAKGIYVDSVDKNSPAEKSGIKSGDILLTMNEQEINTLCKLRELLFAREIGEIVTFQVKRGEELMEVKVLLSEKV
ncbi:MAG: trypsin-like peptidase domain-containing protein [Clostridia bacterium]|nr:trypsin-like peptidase domain-containing protein [Clostridia bacterium]